MGGGLGFAHFVSRLERGVKPFKNPKLRQQVDQCGLKFVRYDVLGQFERFVSDSRKLLNQAGVWAHTHQHSHPTLFGSPILSSASPSIAAKKEKQKKKEKEKKEKEGGSFDGSREDHWLGAVSRFPKKSWWNLGEMDL
mmetsp:Transcript_64739/g.121336  ORF Transcript_64739/g.121336 Transcript_64739/m.121336 type:complete len:138 (+) Transcript_64739:2035-2448(+)